jgi:hypothetical protein
MIFDKDTIDGLNLAFNEATFLGAEISARENVVAITIECVCLNPNGSIPEDRRTQIILKPVGRMCASLRNGRWDDEKAEIIPFSHDKLLETVQSFNGLPVYGWEFFDCGEKGFNTWKDRLSLDYASYETDAGRGHTLDLFQDSSNRILNLRIWFDDIQFFTPAYKEVPIGEFIAAAKRGWDTIMLEGIEEVQKRFCIYPCK